MRLDFYGIGVDVVCGDDAINARVASDFYYFVAGPADRAPDLRLELHRRPPDFRSLPSLSAKIYTPRNISYSDGHVTYIDYFGRALAIFDRSDNRVEVYATDTSLLHEIAYLTILSRVGGALDRRGLHRMHALAVGDGKRAALFMMPSGCGKTTLGLALLEAELGLELVSDDSPLITRSGRVLPFPLRFGVLGNPPTHLPDRFITYMERMEFSPKYLISMEAFEPHLARGERMPDVIFVCNRTLGTEPRVRRAGFFVGLGASVRHMIVGVGLYQGLEFMLQSSAAELMRSTGTGLSRTWAAMRALRRADVMGLDLGRDRESNARAVARFLTERWELDGVGTSAPDRRFVS